MAELRLGEVAHLRNYSQMTPSVALPKDRAGNILRQDPVNAVDGKFYGSAAAL